MSFGNKMVYFSVFLSAYKNPEDMPIESSVKHEFGTSPSRLKLPLESILHLSIMVY